MFLGLVLNLCARSRGGGGTPPSPGDSLQIEDGASALLLEDGTSKLLLEA